MSSDGAVRDEDFVLTFDQAMRTVCFIRLFKKARAENSADEADQGLG